jgi:hypothetical protein
MTQVFLECTCPPGHTATTGAHHPECSHADIDAKVACPPEATQCCQVDHHHGNAANACPGGHDDVACPEPPGQCKVWRGAIADAFHPEFVPGSHPLFSGAKPPPCPGGHCHAAIPDCAVCRPLIITMLPGSAEVTLAGQAG